MRVAGQPVASRAPRFDVLSVSSAPEDGASLLGAPLLLQWSMKARLGGQPGIWLDVPLLNHAIQ